MNSLIQFKATGSLPLRRAFLLIPFLLVCFGFSPTVEAVTPPPDGGYAGGNTAEGQNALFSLTTGAKNTANGYLVLFFNTTGRYNTAIGPQALFNNTTGSDNTAVGLDALFYNITGGSNTAIGNFALFKNIGIVAPLPPPVGPEGGFNTAVGFKALYSNTTGFENTAIGVQALSGNTTGSENAACGNLALNGGGDFNTAMGHAALFNGGDSSTAVGFEALYHNAGGANSAVGFQALFFNTTGSLNTAVGADALISNTNGSYNTACGEDALVQTTTGRGNIGVGSFGGSAVTTADNVIAIGSPGGNVSNSCFIGNIREVTTAHANAIPVLIDSFGQLGTASSSRRFKSEIKPMDKSSECLLALKPVTFHYKNESKCVPQFGLIAEEVAAVNSDLVVRDKNGEIYTVRYDAVNAMLLNEFLKEHRMVQEQGATIAMQEKQIEALTAGLEKVNAQLEANKPTPRVVANNH